jgi:inhibitor of KinA
MRLLPLADHAVMIYLDDENAALRLAATVRRRGFPWLVDVVQAYTSVAVFFALEQMDYEHVAKELAPLEDEAQGTPAPESRFFEIPCCYEFALDLQRIAEHTKLTGDDVIRLHTDTVYTVYAIGFCPGFPYLGYLPPALSGVPRLESPRLLLERGSVGLTGRQTGIYTEPRPGGWNIVGRTPLELVSVADGYFPLRTGDRVRFVRIDKRKFERLHGERL